MTDNRSPRRAFSIAVFPRFEKRVLLIFHKRLQKWLPPGGEMNPGETPLECAARELREETGFEGVFPVTTDLEGTPLGYLGYEEHEAGSKGVHMNFVFVADVPSQEVVNNDEFDAYRWVTLEDGPWDLAPKNVQQFAKLALQA